MGSDKLKRSPFGRLFITLAKIPRAATNVENCKHQIMLQNVINQGNQQIFKVFFIFLKSFSLC
ncbi:hypothetical protein AWQ24_15690 (plasmid) [Picosynechococcus sp. PCC 8807]|nr:hypothetical protein AWQ24_15690 [Picosynechococcus sp. PCC 8807]